MKIIWFDIFLSLDYDSYNGLGKDDSLCNDYRHPKESRCFNDFFVNENTPDPSYDIRNDKKKGDGCMEVS
jgi:hypothetical protein